jgi:hypothetical protein
MRYGRMSDTKNGKGLLDEGGEYWYCCLIENHTRLRLGRGVGRTEGDAAQRIWRYWRWTLGVKQPPPLVSDGWGGHHDALLEVFGKHGAQRRTAGKDWHYLQVVKVRDDYHRVIGLKPRLVWGKDLQATHPLSPNVAYIERTHLTSRLMNARFNRKSLRFSKRVGPLVSSVFWCDMVYNLLHPHNSLRQPSLQPGRRWILRSPAMAAHLTDHLWSIYELLSLTPLFINSP